MNGGTLNDSRLAATDFSRDIKRLTQDFVGREWVFDEIDNWLHRQDQRFFILTGEPGAGKSAIAAKLTQIQRAVGGERLVSDQSHSNGLAAAFLVSGVCGYAGYFWLVTEAGASIFARTFYQHLFLRENVGLAFLEARQRAIRELGEVGDLTGYSAILYGDAASKHRRDLAMAV